MERKSFVLIAGLLGLASCGPVVVTPAISSFNESSVAIQLDGLAMEFADAESRAAAIAEADRIANDTCRRGPRRGAEFASTRNIPTGQYTYITERLYLCLR